MRRKHLQFAQIDDPLDRRGAGADAFQNLAFLVEVGDYAENLSSAWLKAARPECLPSTIRRLRPKRAGSTAS